MKGSDPGTEHQSKNGMDPSLCQIHSEKVSRIVCEEKEMPTSDSSFNHMLASCMSS